MGNNNQKKVIRNLINDLNNKNKCAKAMNNLKELCWDDKKSIKNKKYSHKYQAIHCLVALLNAEVDFDLKDQALDLITYLALF